MRHSVLLFILVDHVMQIGFGQISPSASSTRDLGTRLAAMLSDVVVVCCHVVGHTHTHTHTRTIERSISLAMVTVIKEF